jgi:hypothetical protein
MIVMISNLRPVMPWPMIVTLFNPRPVMPWPTPPRQIEVSSAPIIGVKVEPARINMVPRTLTREGPDKATRITTILGALPVK